MAVVPEIRALALETIAQIEKQAAYANLVLARQLARYDLPARERRLLTEFVYGTVKAGPTLDWLIEQFSSRPCQHMPFMIRQILRLGVFQLFFMTQIPAAAACNEAVKLAKKYGHPGTVRFVNAVLRSAARGKEKVVYPSLAEEPVAHIALKYFHPPWLVERWLALFGQAETIAACVADNTTPPLAVRTNTLKVSRETLMTMLAQEGVTAKPSSLVPEGIVCTSHPALGSLQALRKGLLQVQDESSMLAAHVLAPQPGEFVIDACGAPGGKSTHIAQRMHNQGRVISMDIHKHKLALIRENATRLGIDIIEARQADATSLPRELSFSADRVLVDAPCSGLGVLRRKPDARWHKTPQLLQDLPPLQLAILNGAAAGVRPGGVLVYSTCTVEPRENAGVVNAFLQTHRDFCLDNTGAYLPVPRQDAMVQLYPWRDGTDGFFLARLRRVRCDEHDD